IGVFNLLIRSFYVRRLVRTPVVLVLVFLTLQGLLYVALSRPFGIAGVSWATALAAWAQALVTAGLVARRERFGTGAWAAQAARSRACGIAGVSWATALAAWAQALVTAGRVARRERFGLGAWAAQAARVWLAALGALLAGWLALQAVPLPAGWFGQLGRLAVGGGAMVAAYLLLGVLLRVPELRALGRLVRRRR